jgi:hypothetical protein
MTVITGKCKWASISAPNTTYEPAWQIDVSLDDENLKKVKADGLSIKNKGDDRGNFVTIKRKVEGKKGPNKAPELVDSQRTPMFNTLIGNGSLVNVLYRPYEWEHAGKTGISADLLKVQILDLVPYSNDGDEDFDVVDSGYQSDDDIPFAS